MTLNEEKICTSRTWWESAFFYEAIASTYHQTCELVGFCDVSQTRMDYANRILVNKYGQKKSKDMYAITI